MSDLKAEDSQKTSFIEKLEGYFSTLNYSYGLRVVIGVALSWFIAFRLHTDNPYWSIMTVIIVTMPTQSLLVEKFLARLVGTLVGAISVNVIAAYALDDQWLFAIYMAFWLSLCAYLASARSPMLTYCFALCGYTSAILGFVLSILPTSYAVFQISQARILEILIGLVTAFFISMLWPAYLERVKVMKRLRERRTEVRALYQSLLTSDFDKQAFNKQYEKMLLGLMDFRDLVFQDFLSVSTERKENMAVYRYSHRLMQAASGVLLLDALKRDLQRMMPQPMNAYLTEMHQWFLSNGTQEEKLARKPKAPAILRQHEKGRLFVEKLDEKFEELMSAKLDSSMEASLYIPSMRIYYSDRKEALINAGRTFFSIMLGMAFWMGTQWDTGYILLALIGIICTLGATYPMITKLLTITIGLTMIITVPIVFMVKFGLLIQATSIVPAMLVVLPIYFIAAVMRERSMLGYLVGYGFLLSSSFLIGFSNPMQYDFARFANQVITMVVALSIILIIFNIIRPSSDASKMRRIKGSVITQFGMLVNKMTPKSMRDYEAYLNSAVYKTKIVPAMREKSEFLAYAFLTAAILRAQLKRHEAGSDWIIPEDLLTAIKTEDFNSALEISARLEKEADPNEQLVYWELGCALTSLKDFLESEVSG